MRFPSQLRYNLKLFSMKGSLAVSGSSCCTYTVVDVWVMFEVKPHKLADKTHEPLDTNEFLRKVQWHQEMTGHCGNLKPRGRERRTIPRGAYI
jgi:hypothetical protein